MGRLEKKWYGVNFVIINKKIRKQQETIFLDGSSISLIEAGSLPNLKFIYVAVLDIVI